MGVFDWIPDPMVRKFGQTSRDRAVEIIYVGTEKVDMRSKVFRGRCTTMGFLTIGDKTCE